jgi:hypothetical protein
MGDWPPHHAAKEWDATDLKEKQLPRTMKAVPEFRIKLNGVSIPEIRVQREGGSESGHIQIAVRDADLGWFVVSNDENVHDALPKFQLEYRDETSWALLPDEMKQASEDKGWNQTTPQELIDILWTVGVLR